MKFSTVYPLLVKKAERKGRTKVEVDQLISWLTADGVYPSSSAAAVTLPLLMHSINALNFVLSISYLKYLIAFSNMSVKYVPGTFLYRPSAVLSA